MAVTSDGLQPLLRRGLKYAVAGVASTVLYTLATVLMVEFARFDPVISSVLATSVTVVFSYLLNYRWVFASTRGHAASLLRFVAATCLTLSLNAALMYLIAHVLGYWYGLGMVLVILLVTPINFVVNYLWCFSAPKQRASQERPVRG